LKRDIRDVVEILPKRTTQADSPVDPTKMNPVIQRKPIIDKRESSGNRAGTSGFKMDRVTSAQNGLPAAVGLSLILPLCFFKVAQLVGLTDHMALLSAFMALLWTSTWIPILISFIKNKIDVSPENSFQEIYDELLRVTQSEVLSAVLAPSIYFHEWLHTQGLGENAAYTLMILAGPLAILPFLPTAFGPQLVDSTGGTHFNPFNLENLFDNHFYKKGKDQKASNKTFVDRVVRAIDLTTDEIVFEGTQFEFYKKVITIQLQIIHISPLMTIKIETGNTNQILRTVSEKLQPSEIKSYKKIIQEMLDYIKDPENG
jgi:hypothetical protein